MGIGSIIQRAKEKFRENKKLRSQSEIESLKSNNVKLEEDVKIRKELDALKLKEQELKTQSSGKGKTLERLKTASKGLKKYLDGVKERREKSPFNQSIGAQNKGLGASPFTKKEEVKPKKSNDIVIKIKK